jgi:hypothetical protein
LPGEEHLASLRGRVGQGVDAIAGSANKVILGVVDSSFGVLRAFLPGQTTAYGGTGAVPVSALFAVPVSAGVGTGTGTSGETGVRPSLGLLRRDTGFSIASLTAALPGGPGKPKSQSHPEEEGQRELVEVSPRPPSFRSGHEGSGSETEGSSEEDSEESEGEEGDGEEGEDEGKEGEGEQEEEEVHDTKSIKSFESMLSSGRTKRKKRATPSSAPGSSRRRKQLTDLTDRFTHGVAGMSRRVQGGDAQRASTRLPPPNRRFVECTEQDIRVSEVGELLREYQRLVEAVRSAGGFQE